MGLKMTIVKQGVKKVVLAYSGGLDTSVIVRWLIENYGCEVVCFVANMGGEGLDGQNLRKKAKNSGAKKIVISGIINIYLRS